MRNIKLTIEYDGTAYCGWQVQPNGVTVQELIEKAVAKMTGKVTRVSGASRTDAGVHAFGQVANFHTASKISCDGFLKGLNSLLPADISIRRVDEVPEDFHAKSSARGKHYRYLIYLSASKPALFNDRVWHLKKDLGRDICKRINRSARPLIGMHDFSAFCASGDTNRSKIREIDKITCKEANIRFTEGDARMIVIDVIGTGFLKYMVRNIVGTLVLAKGPGEMKKVLATRDRTKAGKTAPASGLYLIRVFY